MNVTLEQITPQLRAGQVDVTIHVSAALNISAYAAKQKAAGILVSRVGATIGADEPELVISHSDLSPGPFPEGQGSSHPPALPL